MKVWITRYALTEGIREVDATYISEDRIGYRLYNQTNSVCMSRKNVDWHTDFEWAKYCAEQMRQAKIASLKKQIAKLEKLEF